MQAKTRIGLLMLLGLLFMADCQAQQYLYMKKKYTAKTRKIPLGDVITVKNTSGEKFKGQLTTISEEAISVDFETVDLNDIEFIRINHTFWKNIGKGLIYGGAMFTGIFITNSLINSYDPILTDGNLIFLGSLYGAGMLLEVIFIRTMKMEKGWKIEPVITPEE